MTLTLLLVCAAGTIAGASERRSNEPASPTTLGEARELLMAGAYEQALAAFGALAEDPRYARPARLGIARCRLQLGRYKEAVSDLNKLDLDDSAERHYLLAALYRRVGEYEQVLAHARSAIAQDKHHAGARRLLAETLEMLGRRAEAVEAYRWFDDQLRGRAELPGDAEWITETALGFLRYSVLTRNPQLPRRTRYVLNEMLQVAYERVDRTYWPARIAAADLLREKYNNDEEDGSLSDYKAALRINKNLPQAYVGMGEVALENWDFEEVERLAGLALNINPNEPAAIRLLAKKSVLERRYDRAIETCERALSINPNDLAALSIRAAAGACQYDDAEVGRSASRVATINPKCALFHRTLGDALSGIRQYAASERRYLKAIELDPTDANAHTELGMMYMQWGVEGKARDVLDRAFALDPYNERTKFTLELLDQLDKLDRVETEHFVVKYDAGRDPGLGQFVAGYAESIYESVTGDYDTPLSGRTIIEVFPTHRAFGVRITGKPWIHTIGASTGRVIALASPRDPAGLGRYNLARVLKHEFTHTVTLEATHNRIPHWFTEGLAVYQEDAPRPFAWCEMLAEAVRRDRLFTLESIDWGFIRPRRPNDRQLAYAQSEWMCEYIAERFGYDTLNAMIRRFRKGLRQDQVFVEQLGITTADFDRDFRAWSRKQAARWGFDLTPPESTDELRLLARTKQDDASVLGRLARAEWDEGDLERALSAARRAIQLDGSERTALEVLAKVLAAYAREADDASVRRAYDDEALPALERLLELDPDGWTAPKYLADIALRREEFDRAVTLLMRLQRVCPIDPASWRGLAGIYLQRSREERALPQLLELARMDGNDAEVPAEIAAVYRRRGRLRDAQFWYRSALYIDPFNVNLHEALGDTNMRVGDTKAALGEYRILTALEPENAGHFENAAFAAHKLGDKDAAVRLAREAVKLDPASSARALLP